MKKSVLFVLAAGLWFGADAQNASKAKVISLLPYAQQAQLHRNEGKPTTGSFFSQGTHSRTQQGSNARVASTGVPVGGAYNSFGVYDATTTAVTADQATGLITMTHREDNLKPGGSGAYEISYSIDGGNTWDSNYVMFYGQTSRYPNGVIFNPAGNTKWDSAYVAVCGPWTNSTSWVKTVYGSIKMDSTAVNENIWANGTPGVYTQNNGDLSFMQACDDSTVHSIGQGFTEITAGSLVTYLGAVLNYGKFNSASFDFTWTQQLIRPHFMNRYKGALPGDPYDSIPQLLNTPGMAWSQDGKIGYVLFFGNLDSAGYNYATYQPIVYRTSDAGVTWTMMPPYNYRNIPNLVQYLQPSQDSGFAIPMWDLIGQNGAQGEYNEYDMTVDKNGNLHILGSITSAPYASPDSGYAIYSYNNPKYYIYDVYNTTTTGGWKARFIDSLFGTPTYSVSTGAPWSSNGTNQVNYGARIQASRTPDGSKIFCTWEDDYNNPTILYPDVYGQGYDVVKKSTTPTYQFTSTIDQYFLCVSNVVLTSGTFPNTKYMIPCTYEASVSPGNDGTGPVVFYYQANVVYGDTSFPAGINELNKTAGFSVTPNYPNPFSKTTQFNITLDKASTVSVDVFNMIGEKVQAIEPTRIAPGVHTITLNSNGMNAGVYFYRVTADGQAVTHKMIIQ